MSNYASELLYPCALDIGSLGDYVNTAVAKFTVSFGKQCRFYSVFATVLITFHAVRAILVHGVMHWFQSVQLYKCVYLHRCASRLASSSSSLAAVAASAAWDSSSMQRRANTSLCRVTCISSASPAVCAPSLPGNHTCSRCWDKPLRKWTALGMYIVHWGGTGVLGVLHLGGCYRKLRYGGLADGGGAVRRVIRNLFPNSGASIPSPNSHDATSSLSFPPPGSIIPGNLLELKMLLVYRWVLGHFTGNCSINCLIV